VIWLVWRRQRTALLTAAGVAAVFAIALVAGRVAFHAHLGAHGIDEGCLRALSDVCRRAAAAALFGGAQPSGFGMFWGLGHSALLAMPLVAGLLAGAGLFRREVEEGTYALALTQSVTVTRWWATGLLVAGVPVAVLAGLLGVVAAWAYAPFGLLGNMPSPLETPLFENSGIAPVAYGLLAFALAAGTGLVARGSLAPAAVAVAGYGVVMFVLATIARPQYLPPEITVQAIDYSRSDLGITDVAGGWTVERRWVDDQGAPRALGCADESFPECLRSAGVTGYERHIQPDSRYWAFQLTESGVLLTLTVVALTATHPRFVVRRRHRGHVAARASGDR
jgi:hypothetical protein